VILNEFAEHCWTFLPVTKKTISNYKGAYTRNVSSNLGKKEMGDISKREFLEMLAPLTAPNYFQTLMTIRVIYREAIAREILTESPVANIRAPNNRPKAQKFLTWEEIRQTDFGKYDTHIKFLALHGLRWGEAVALTWSDIYEEKVHINRSIYGPTKSPSGVRDVPYFGYFKEFPRSRTAIAEVLRQHNVTIHSLRKTYAYFLKTNSVHVTTAAKFMGHADPTITLRIYTLVRDTEIDEIGSRLRRFLSNS
jgi:integrase